MHFNRCSFFTGCSVNAINSHGHTPLILAAKAGHVTLTRWLLIHGADPNRCASISPYQLAVSYGKVINWYYITQTLIFIFFKCENYIQIKKDIYSLL